MEDNGNDFDAAAMGLPTGFGAVSKQIPKKQKQAKADVAAFDSTKRSEASQSDQAEATIATNGHAMGASSALRSAHPEDVFETSRLDDREQPEAGSSSGFVRNGGTTREDVEQDDNRDDEEDDAQAGDDTEYFPVSHEIVMKDHTKAVTALAVDPPGARVITGGYDYDVKLWDFGGMQADFRPFRSFEPYENYHIHDVAWDSTGSNFVVIPGTLTPKLYDRDGNELAEFAKGDMYLRDLKNTAGHVGQLTSVSWHPTDSTKFMTSSMDSTMRIWDTSDRFKSKTTIVVKSKERGNRTKITNATYSIDGKQIAAAGTDGTINIWATNSNFARPNHTADNAHEKGTETSSLTFSLDNRTLASRGGDGTVKLWDIRKFKKPLSVAFDLTSNNPETNVIFSPDEKYVLTGTAGPKAGIVPGKDVDVRGKAGGRIVVMKRENLEIVREYNVSEGSVIRLAWHPRINQILASTSLGEVKVLYSPTLSEKGATLAAARAPKQRRALDDYVDPADQPIITPHALPMFKDSNAYEVSDAGTATKRKRENVRNNAQKSRKPDVPVRGPGHGGRVGEAADRHMVAGMAGDMRSEDPREALLKYATKEGDKQWTKAWGADQKTLYDNTPEPEAPPKKK